VGKRKIVKKTIRYTFKAIGAEQEFAPGMGVGVLGIYDSEFTVPADPTDYEATRIADAIHAHKDKLMDDIISIDISEVTTDEQRH
jgi:hypothetical protein